MVDAKVMAPEMASAADPVSEIDLENVMYPTTESAPVPVSARLALKVLAATAHQPAGKLAVSLDNFFHGITPYPILIMAEVLVAAGNCS